MASVIGLGFLDSTSVLAIRGVRPRYPEAEKAIQQMAEEALVAALDCQMEEVTARVVLLSETTTDVHARVCGEGQSPLSASAVSAAASRITARTGYRSKVRVELIPYQTFPTFQPGDFLPGCTRCR